MSASEARVVMESPLDSADKVPCLTEYQPIEVRFYDNFDELVPLREWWDEFMAEVKADLWLSFDWCRLWWKYYGRDRKLAVFLFYRNGRLIAIFPLIFDHLKIWPLNLRVFKLVGTDFTIMTVGLPVKREMIPEVMERLIHELDSRFRWDLLRLGPLSGRSDITEEFINRYLMKIRPHHEIHLFHTGVQTYFQVKESWEKQLSSLKKKQRHNFRRATQSLQKMGRKIGFELAENANLKLWFNEFADMHGAYWVSQGQGGHFVDWPSSRIFHEEFAATQLNLGRLFLMKVNVDGNCVGYKYGYMFGDTCYTVLSARQKNGIGAEIDFNRLTFQEVISHARERGLKWIDSMRGYYSHKMELGGTTLPVKMIMVWPKGKNTQVKLFFFKLISFLNQAYIKIWRRRIAPRLRLAPKHLSERYIRFSLFHE